MTNYIEPDYMTREEKIKLIMDIRNPMYQRVRDMRDDRKYSQAGVEAYDEQMDYLKSHYNWFNPTGNMPKIDLATDKELSRVVSRLIYTDTLKTMNKLGAKSFQKTGEYLFKGYNELASSEQSALWRLADRLKDKNIEVDSDTTLVLMKRVLEGGKMSFAKDEKGKTQVSTIVLKGGAVYSADPKGSEYSLYNIIDGLEASVTEHVTWRLYLDDAKKYRRKLANKRLNRFI